MKKVFCLFACLFILFSTACQSSKPVPVLEPTQTARLVATPSFTLTLSPTAAISPLTTTPPPPTSEPVKSVNVMPFCTTIGKPQKTFVKAGTPVNVIWGWSAKTEQQIKDFLDNNITVITLDGKVLEGIRVGDINKNARNGEPEVNWYASAGILEPGQHTLTYDVKWKKMINDGSSTYGPGGKLETVHDQCEIIVGSTPTP